MKTSKFHLMTTRETPADAEIASHQLMLRSGMIRKLTASGTPAGAAKTLYTSSSTIYTPLSLGYAGGSYALAFYTYISPDRIMRLLRFNTSGAP